MIRISIYISSIRSVWSNWRIRWMISVEWIANMFRKSNGRTIYQITMDKMIRIRT